MMLMRPGLSYNCLLACARSRYPTCIVIFSIAGMRIPFGSEKSGCI